MQTSTQPRLTETQLRVLCTLAAATDPLAFTSTEGLHVGTCASLVRHGYARGRYGYSSTGPWREHLLAVRITPAGRSALVAVSP
jgi:hypothetical protein